MEKLNKDNNFFVDIIDFEGLYQINKLGEIKSLNYNRSGLEKLLPFNISTTGYYYCDLRKNSISKKFKIHRLLAINFIPNPLNLPCVNHKDGNKLNNNLENLEWCTHKENMIHACITKLLDTSKGYFLTLNKQVINTQTNIIYKSAKEAALQNGLKYSTFKSRLNGNIKNNTQFKYLHDYN
jgi:hypothetical protein